MQHLDEGTIHAWLDGALSADEAARVELHVGSCETCSDAVAEARGLIAASSRILTALDDVPRASSVRWGQRDRGDRRPFLVTWRVAAVLALVAGGGALALAGRQEEIPTAALQATAAPESAATLVALDAPAADAAEVPPPPDVDGMARMRAEAAPGRGSVGAIAEGAPVEERRRERDLRGFASAESVAMNVAQAEAQAAAAPPPASPARTDDTARLPSVVIARARVTADTARVEGRSSVTEKVGSVLGGRRSVADASARFAEPAAPQARPLAAPEPNVPRLLTEERMIEADGRVVVRRVYRVEETLVTLDERAPHAQLELEQRRSAREEQQSAAGSTPADSAAAPTATIRWVDARGTEFTLSGAVPEEQLERLRRLLGY